MSINKSYSHIFFDLDHTLWDFETNSALTLKMVHQEFELVDKGIADFESFHKYYREHNIRLWDKYSKGLIKQDELRWKRMWHTLLDHKIGDEALARSMSQRYLEILPLQGVLFDYTREILTYLQKKEYQLHIISNGFEEVQHHKLNHSGLKPFFKTIVTSQGCNYVKPQPGIFNYALNASGALAQESLMVGDNQEADIQGAINAGIDTLFVNHIGEELRLEPTYTIRHLKEIEQIL